MFLLLERNDKYRKLNTVCGYHGIVNICNSFWVLVFYKARGLDIIPLQHRLNIHGEYSESD